MLQVSWAWTKVTMYGFSQSRACMVTRVSIMGNSRMWMGSVEAKERERVIKGRKAFHFTKPVY